MTDSNILCSNGTNREIFCLILSLCVICLLSTFLHISDLILPSVRLEAGRRGYDDFLVQWHPSFNDSNVYYLQDVELGAIFVFNPTAFTGADSYARLIKNFIIRSGNTDVKIFNLTGSNPKSMPLGHQTRYLSGILFDSRLSYSFIISEARVSDIINFHFNYQPAHPSVSVSFLRHPFDAFVASFYYHHHGQMLFTSSNNETRQQFLFKLNQAVGEVEKYVESEKGLRTYANDISAVVPFCGWNNSKCVGVHPGRAEWVLARAKKNVIKDSNTFIGLMEDFKAIPGLLERLSPDICKGLRQYLKSQTADFTHWLDTKLHLKPSVQEKLKKDKRLKIELRFYEWVKKRYYNEKKKRLRNPDN